MGIKQRIDTIAHKVETGWVKLPRSVKLELAAVCNHNCVYCSVPKLQKDLPVKFMDIELYKKCVDDLYALKIKELGLFHMGESTLHPQFKEMVRYATDKKWFSIFITTNGTHLEMLKECVKLNIKSIKFSLNGYSRRIHKEVTGKDDFSRIIKNLKDLIAYRNEIGSTTEISASSIYYNTPEQDVFAKKMSEIADAFYMTPIYNHAGKVDNKYIKLTDNKFIISNTCDKPCFGLWNLGHIKVDGTINMCRFGMDHEFDIGHINDGFMHCWFGDKAREIRRRHKADEIETCKKCLGLSKGE